MRATLIFMVLLALVQPGSSEDMQQYLETTQNLVQQGKHKEASERMIWFHDHALEHEPAMYGVRLSFALKDWKELGDVYPPAKKAMVETRDRKLQQMESGKGTFELFHDVAALNDTLQEVNKTIELFELLDKQNPELAKLCWPVAKDKLMEYKHFDLATKYFGNLLDEFQKIKTQIETLPDLLGDTERDEYFKEWLKNEFVNDCLQLIEVAVARDDRKSALEIQKGALAVVDDQRLRDAIKSEKQEDEQQPKTPDNK